MFPLLQWLWCVEFAGEWMMWPTDTWSTSPPSRIDWATSKTFSSFFGQGQLLSLLLLDMCYADYNPSCLFFLTFTHTHICYHTVWITLSPSIITTDSTLMMTCTTTCYPVTWTTYTSPLSDRTCQLSFSFTVSMATENLAGFFSPKRVRWRKNCEDIINYILVIPSL